MSRMCIAVIALLLGVSAGPWARAARGNRLINPSFESGRGAPDGWSEFGLGTRRWEYLASDGDRSLGAVGDGLNTNGWFASRWFPTEANRVFGVSLKVRQKAQGDTGWVFAGLNEVRRYCTAVDRWEEQRFHLRSPDHRANVRFEVGQSRLSGTAYFDEVALYPSVPVYRSRGPGRYVMGDGERIIDWQYSAEFRSDPSQMNNRRFVLRSTGDFVHDRWVLGSLEVVYFVHEVEFFGVADKGPGVRLGPMAREQLGGRWSESDPESLRLVAQEGGHIEVDVGRCEGTLFVQVARSLNGPWHMLGEARAPGTYTYVATPEIFPSRHIFVRLMGMQAKRIEITGYRYRATLVHDRKEEPVQGATYYVDVLHQLPELQFKVLDVGEFVVGGRNGARVEFNYTGPRRRLVMTVMIKKGNALAYLKEQFLNVVAGSQTVRTVLYEITSPGRQTLMVLVRDEKTSDLLLDLECNFEAPEAALPATPAGPPPPSATAQTDL